MNYTANEPPYVIYCRKSTDESGKQEDSIPSQIKACVEYQRRHGGFEIADIPSGIDLEVFAIEAELENQYKKNPTYAPFLDDLQNKFIVIERKSAKRSGRRPRWQALMKLIKQGKVKGILSYAPDRCSRNMGDAGELIDLVDQDYLDLKFPTFTFEKTPAGKMMLTMLFGFAKHYSDNRSQLTTRGQVDKGNKGEALGTGKYGYRVNENGYFEPDPKYRDMMQGAFILKSYQGKSDKVIAEWLNKQGFKILRKVGRNNPLYGKCKYFEATVNYKNLGDVWIDPFYYGILIYGEGRYDQRALNPYYGEPMITEEEHRKLVERSQKHYSTLQQKAVKEKNENVYPIPLGMVVDVSGRKFSPGVPNQKKRHLPRLVELQRQKPDATLGDVLEPHHIKYRCNRSGSENITIDGADLIVAVRQMLGNLHVLQRHYDAYVAYVKNKVQSSQKQLSERRQILLMQKSRLEKEYNEYIESVLPALGTFGDKEKEIYETRKAGFEGKIKEIDEQVKHLEENRKEDIVTSLVFFELMKDAVEYYDNASYVQKRQIAEVFFSNIVISDEKAVTINIKPMLADLFSGMVGDTGLEPVTSAMSMQRSRQLS